MYIYIDIYFPGYDIKPKKSRVSSNYPFFSEEPFTIINAHLETHGDSESFLHHKIQSLAEL